MIGFWYGTTEQYTALTAKAPETIYFITNGNGGVYRGNTKVAELSSAAVQELQGILGNIEETGFSDVATALNTLKDAITTLNGNETVAGSVKKSIADAIAALDLDNTYDAKGAADAVLGKETDTATFKTVYGALAAVKDEKNRATTVEGSLDDLATVNKTNLVAAINELANDESMKVTITEEEDSSYTVKQGGTSIGVITVPRDILGASGEVVENPEGKEPGTYIKFTFDSMEEPLYINAASLIDSYHAEQEATQIQLFINPSTRVISATIVDGGVTAAKLADNAVTTAKIADGNVTKEKLATSLQGSLELAGSAVQVITEGNENGNINVDGTEVPVHGLKSAAFTDASAYDAAGAAQEVKTELDERISAIESALTWKTAATN